MLETSARLLRLLSVLQRQRFWSGNELASDLEVTPRTLRRDIDRLRSLGYAVEATSGPGGGYQLGKGSTIPPLQLGDDEAVAVAVALQSAADTFLGVSETAARVLAKLDRVLPARLRRRVSALGMVTVSILGSGARLDPDILTVLASACRDHERLELAYLDRTQRATRRKVEPLRLAHVGNRRWYLIAYDLDKDAWRTFRVDRIEAIHAVGPRFTPREAPEDLTQYVSDAIAHSPYRYRARLKLHGSADALAKRVPPWCGVLEPLDDESSFLSTGANSIESLVCLMVLAGVDFELLEPKTLAPQVRAISERLARAIRAIKKRN